MPRLNLGAPWETGFLSGELSCGVCATHSAAGLGHFLCFPMGLMLMDRLYDIPC